MAGVLKAADDMVRIIANGVTFGGADRLAAALGERDAAARTAAARERAGFAGDVASVLGFGGGVGAAFKGGKAALKAIPAVGRAVISKKGAAGAALGLGSLASYNARTSNAPAKPAAVAKPRSSVGGKKPAGTGNADAAADNIMAALRSIDSAPPTFESVIGQALAQDGGVSLRQLGALSEVAARTTPKAVKPLRPQDIAIGRLQAYYDGVREQELAAGVPQADADARWAGRYEGLAKMSPIDAMIRGAAMDEGE